MRSSTGNSCRRFSCARKQPETLCKSPHRAPRERGFFCAVGIRSETFSVIADNISVPRYAPSMRVRKIGILLFGFALFVSSGLAQQATATSQPGAGSELTLLSPDHKSVVLAAAELKAMSHISVTIHNAHTDADETYSGVRVVDLLSKLGAPLGSDLRGKALANYIVATGSDGYKAVLALAEIDPSFHPGEVLVADTMNGKPLDEHSGPLKLVVTEDKRPARSVRNLTTIELRSVQ
jgi:hypothetical protein